MSSSPSARPPDVQVIDQLFELQESFFAHVLQCLETLDLDEIRLLGLPVGHLGLVSTPELAVRFNLVKKYRLQLAHLHTFDEAERVYTTLFEFISPSLAQLERCFLQKLANFAVEPKNDLSTENHTFLGYFVNYFFPGDQLTRVVQFVRDSPAHLQLCRGNLQASRTMLDTRLPEVFGELSFEMDIFLIKYNLEQYSLLYPHRNTDEKQAAMFKLSILKELAFDPEINDEFEANYENSILRRILNNEMNSSPNTFDESQQKVLDLMEIVTFHLDSIPRVYDLVLQFIELLTLKKVPLENKTTKAPMPNYCHHYKNMLEKWVAECTTLTDRVVEQGTMGLSYTSTFFELGFRLQTFHLLLKDFLNFNIKTSYNRLFYKDELHFYDQIHSYCECFDKIVAIIKTHYTDPDQLRNSKFAEFETTDSLIKDAFFDLHHFHQRFQYERKISRIFHEVQPP
ncbi:uncharacterized protein CANTADRAFT_21889 [Suhomyces tanzawaensis NRRL Y-17324]|uniref:Uncharacterized protein n=1 Tax=Suhomyces tanzawaensis NRRL Y-17324 TaxID=984487 RepID=A0A1E4SI17_9ASCO|nr:uncharacterized protein CANTADRAFT_21889 [Suhomyces tanzawaensis NRRL Y-17324]ODV79120.1 hypothetical protein CANTADRAFT_21889 [Suhomyces tanzawaensis NRRL Y-17324]